MGSKNKKKCDMGHVQDNSNDGHLLDVNKKKRQLNAVLIAQDKLICN